MSQIEAITKKIDEEYKWLMQTKHTLHDIDIAFNSIKKFVCDLEQEPCVAMRDLSDEEIKHFAEEMKKVRLQTMTQEPSEDWHDVPSYEMTLGQARQAVKELRKKLAEHLEQESCEDAISRQAAIEALNCRISPTPESALNDMEYKYKKELHDLGMRVLHTQRKNIQALPPVTPTHIETVTEFADRCMECGKQKKGKWIAKENIHGL